MTYLDTWRQNLKTHLAEFAPLAKEDRTINLIYGITAAAVLWGVRDAPFEDEQKAALRQACGDDEHLKPLLRAVGGWDEMTQLEAARALSKRQRNNDDLQAALNALMSFFIEDLFAEKIVQQQRIDINAPISGGNIVIGGYQIVAGDLVIQHITQQKVRACPTAPKPPTHFAGRRDELNRLKEVLSQGQSVAITGIQGVGGIGKTALSLQLASEMSEFSAILWASLGPTPNTGNQLIEWARHADPDFDPGQDDLDLLVSRVQALLTNLIQDECSGRVLVILDDIWEGDSVRAARILQKAAPVNSVSLITTRSQRVVAQLRSTRLELQPMTPEDALQMFRNLLADYPDISDDTLLELAEVVGYHPLAMELAAGQVTLLERPTQDIAAQIERYRGGISAGSPFRDIGLELGDDREDNLELVLSFSYASLSETEQAHFRALGVLAYNAPFDRDICRAIWDDDPIATLDDLRHRAMLNIAENEGWYQQHILLRSYARALLNKHHEINTSFGRYADYIITVAEDFDKLPMEAWEQLDNDLPHIDHIGDELARLWADEANRTDDLAHRAGDFAWHVMRYVNNRPLAVQTDEGVTLRGINWLEVGLGVYQIQGDQKREAATLNNIGLAWRTLGDVRKALEFYHQALPIQRQVRDKSGEATILDNIGGAWHHLGEVRKALEFYHQALPLSRQVGNKSGEATTFNNIGSAWDSLGDKRKALDFYHQALPLSRQVGDQSGEATTLNNIGFAWRALGDVPKALEFYHQALPLWQQVGDQSGEATTLNNIGLAWDSLGEVRKALDFYHQALPIQRQVGGKRSEAATLNNIGFAWQALGDVPKALEFYHQALLILIEIEDKTNQATTLNNIGLAWYRLGEVRKALEFYHQALLILIEIEDKTNQAGVLNNIGGAWHHLGEVRKALEFYHQALPIQRQVGDKRGEATTLVNIAVAQSQIRNIHEAIEHMETARDILVALNLTQDSAGQTLVQYDAFLAQLRGE